MHCDYKSNREYLIQCEFIWKKLLQCEDMSSLSVKKSISKIVVATYTIGCEKTNCE